MFTKIFHLDFSLQWLDNIYQLITSEIGDIGDPQNGNG